MSPLMQLFDRQNLEMMNILATVRDMKRTIRQLEEEFEQKKAEAITPADLITEALDYSGFDHYRLINPSQIKREDNVINAEVTFSGQLAAVRLCLVTGDLLVGNMNKISPIKLRLAA